MKVVSSRITLTKLPATKKSFAQCMAEYFMQLQTHPVGDGEAILKYLPRPEWCCDHRGSSILHHLMKWELSQVKNPYENEFHLPDVLNIPKIDDHDKDLYQFVSQQIPNVDMYGASNGNNASGAFWPNQCN